MTMSLFDMEAIAPIVVQPDQQPTHPPLDVYPYVRADGVAVAHPLDQAGWSGSTPTSALQLRFDPLDFATARRLNALWHSRLPYLHVAAAGGGHYHANYVAEHDGGWYAAAIWSSPIALNRMGDIDPLSVIELRRLAICAQSPRNIASRMLSWMVRDLSCKYPRLVRCISYQDTAVHDGTIYKAAGWRPREATKWVRWGIRSDRTGTAYQQAPTPKVRWEFLVRREAK